MTRLRLLILILLVVLTAGVYGSLRQLSATDGSVAAPNWAAPSIMALKRIASVSPHQNEPVYLSNLDCTLVEYRLVSDTTMRSGCFTPTAFGQIDADSDIVIFNGTDEGLQLLPTSPHTVLAPWPKALDLVAIDPLSTGGSYLSLYKNPLASLQSQRNILGQLTAKQLTRPPELPLVSATGQRLVVNPQSLSYSANGAWMVVEVMAGSFTRINLATLEQKEFATTYSRQGSPALDSSSVTISGDGRYVAVENTYATEFKVYDLHSCSGDRCVSYNYWPFIGSHIPGLRYLSHVRFVNDGLLSFDATTGDSATSGTYELAPTAGIQSLLNYLGLGDSYSSGQGAFDYLGGTDSDDNRCHLSINSYPMLLTRDLYSGVGGHSVACSGAIARDVGDLRDSYRGQVKSSLSWNELQQQQPALLASIMSNYLPGYVAQQRFVEQYQPAVITLGVGGNNMGFGNILQRCVRPAASLRTVTNTCFSTYEDRRELLSLINRTGRELQSLYQQLQRQDPSATLYVVGYPSIAVDNGQCAVNVQFNTLELAFVQQVVDAINHTISLAASASGAHYVDISQALVGHRLCEASRSVVAVNGLTAGDDGGFGSLHFLGGESYHPNALGHQLIEQSILTSTDNLRLARDAASPVASAMDSTLLDAPVSGRPVRQLSFGELTTTVRPRAGQMLDIKVDMLGAGLTTDQLYHIRLDGSDLDLGILPGSGEISVTLPPGIVPGVHSIDLIGDNQIEQPIDISQLIVVVPDGPLGDCWPATDSGLDEDGDGLDDGCDPVVQPSSGGPTSTGQPPTSSAPTSSSIPTNSSPSGVTLALTIQGGASSLVAGRAVAPVAIE
ncbi:MAG: SGNH/GDSL hydrolase family protein, partial [Candidatus Saccharimonadales bacterium]